MIHLPIWPALGWSWYQDANSVPNSPLFDDLTIVGGIAHFSTSILTHKARMVNVTNMDQG